MLFYFFSRSFETATLYIRIRFKTSEYYGFLFEQEENTRYIILAVGSQAERQMKRLDVVTSRYPRCGIGQRASRDQTRRVT